MTRNARRAIFFLAIIIFVAVGFAVVLYAQGYRYDFVQARFSRTGAVSLRANTQANVFVDGVKKDTTSFITNSASVSGLLPGVYTVKVQKDDYSKWQKKVTVQEGYVQDFPHVILLPMAGTDRENVMGEIKELLYPAVPSPKPTVTPIPTVTKTPRPSPTPAPTPDITGPYYIDKKTLFINSPDGPISVATGVSDAFRSPDGQKLIWFVGNQVWLYWLNDQNEQPFHKAGDIAVIGRFSQPIKAISWFRGNAHIAVDADLPGQGTFKVIEIDTRGGQNIISL